MTFTRVVSTPVSVTAWLYQLADEEEPKIRLGLGTVWADLSRDDAASLGGYLLSHTQKEDGE